MPSPNLSRSQSKTAQARYCDRSLDPVARSDAVQIAPDCPQSEKGDYRQSVTYIVLGTFVYEARASLPLTLIS